MSIKMAFRFTTCPLQNMLKDRYINISLPNKLTVSYLSSMPQVSKLDKPEEH